MSKNGERFEFNPAFYEGESFTARDISNAQEERRSRRQEEFERNEARKAKRKQIAKTRRYIIVIILLVLIGVIGLIGKNIFSILEMWDERDAAKAKLDALKNKEGALQEELEQVNTDEYIEQQARSNLKMIRPGETLYLIMDYEGKSKSGDDQ